MTDDVPDLAQLALARTVLQLIIQASAPGAGGARDPDAAVDAVVIALAVVMEQAPEISTPRDMRKASETFSKRLLHYLKLMRTMHETSGIRPIDRIMAADQISAGSVH